MFDAAMVMQRKSRKIAMLLMLCLLTATSIAARRPAPIGPRHRRGA